MLVSRQHDSDKTHWSMSKYESLYHKSEAEPRMSNTFDAALSSQSGWQGPQYSYLPPGESPIYSQSNGHGTTPSGTSDSQASPRSATDSCRSADVESRAESKAEPDTVSSPLSLRRGAGSLGLLQRFSSPTAQPSENPAVFVQEAAEGLKEEMVASVDVPMISIASTSPVAMSAGRNDMEVSASQSGPEDQLAKQEDEDEVIDEDDMVDGDAEAALQQMTPAERTAARRKMKRFRLTHQQTRFLMSEFAKQPHPDAAHREKLSREIPGLSPRQVQVWFQNRRAKIKRLTADDRERMIKMRAVPDDFDNVQALHSPYGAVHGLGAPMASPQVGFSPGPYPDHLLRGPMVVDVRRPDGSEHMSPSGLSPAFGNVGFNSSASMSHPDLLTPLPQEHTDRYDYSNHLSPLSVGTRASNPFVRQSGMEPGMSVQNQTSRQQMRPLQPLQLRETLSRSRSDNLQSPLRSSMSWKGDSIDYSSYHAVNGSTTPLSGRQQSVYHPSEGLDDSTPTTLACYEPSTYAGSSVTSPTPVPYSNFPSSSFQDSQSRSRMRSSSATLPLGLDLSGQRSYSTSQHGLRSATSPTLRPAAVTSAPYSTGFATAPLTAPSDFSLPRTPGFPARPQDYSIPQLSAPIAPPNDFSQAFHASLGSGHSSRSPLRDQFGGGGPLCDRSGEDFGGPGGELKRKRSYPTITQGSSTL